MFADQSLCCYTVTINNEERVVSAQISLAKCRLDIKVNAGYKLRKIPASQSQLYSYMVHGFI